MVTVNSPIKSTLTAVSSQVLAGKIRFQVLPILKSANRRSLYRWGDGPCTDTSVNIPISDFLSLKFITFPFIRCKVYLLESIANVQKSISAFSLLSVTIELFYRPKIKIYKREVSKCI